MFLCLHGGWWQRFVCQMQIVIVLLEYKVEGDRTNTEGLFSEMELKQIVEILYWMRCVTGSQCRVSSIGWIWSEFSALHTSLAAAFWTFWTIYTISRMFKEGGSQDSVAFGDQGLSACNRCTMTCNRCHVTCNRCDVIKFTSHNIHYITPITRHCHANILPSTGQENNIAQPKTDKWFNFSSHFSFFTV